MVISAPSKKPVGRMIQSFRVLVMNDPTCCPIGSIASSAPRVKNIIPTISSAPPSRNASSTLLVTGAMLSASASTIATIGSTACSASFSFSRSLARSMRSAIST